jgi:alkylation response protein AidB-like acyl-CoA dehydrogenase
VEIGVSGARNLVRKAAWLADNEPGEHPGLGEAAFAYAAAVATHGTTTAAHMQGGLGFTVEADASLYFLRAKGWSVLGGDPGRAVMAVGDALIARYSTQAGGAQPRDK